MKNKKKSLILLLLFTAVYPILVWLFDDIFNGAFVDFLFTILNYPLANKLYLARDLWAVGFYIFVIMISVIIYLARKNHDVAAIEYEISRAEQEKSNMILYLAHDLKTPLTSVLGYLTLLRDTPDLAEDQRQKFTETAIEKAERLEMLINEFFDFSKLTIGNIPLEKKTVDLTVMLLQIIEEFYPMLSEKRLIIKKDIENNLNYSCDSENIARLFENLIKNAVSYSDNDTEIVISAKKDRGKILVSISNIGKTLSEDALSHLFDKFFREDSSRKTNTGGAGLGLAIAKEIAELHGGSISVASADGVTTFKTVLKS